MIHIDYVALHKHEPEPSSIFHEKQSNGISDEFGFVSPAMDLGSFFFVCLFILSLSFLPGRWAHIFSTNQDQAIMNY